MEAEIRPSTGSDIYQWLREVCSPKLIVGGFGVIVQTDESLFRHKPKVNNCTYLSAKIIYPLFSLLPIIQAHVQPGTIIHQDCWAPCRHVSSLTNVAFHSTVNHSIEFVFNTLRATGIEIKSN